MKKSFKKASHKRLKKRRKLNPAGLILLLIWLSLTVGFADIYNKSYRPVLLTAAGYRAEYLLNKTVSETVSEIFEKNAVAEKDIITEQTDPEGNIVSVKANLVFLSLLKSGLTSALNEKLVSRNQTDILIPLGNLTGLDVFSGLGPAVKTRLIASGSASVDFVSSFTSVGINQTRQLLSVRVTSRLSYLLPGALSDEVSLISEFPVTEIIIAGDVPDSLTDLQTELESIRDDILDLQ